MKNKLNLLLALIAFTTITASIPASADQIISPGQTTRANFTGERISCSSNFQPPTNSCMGYISLPNEHLREVLVNGLGNCYARSFNENPYRCSLYSSLTGDIVTSTYDDKSCFSLFKKVRSMLKNGSYDNLCGGCF